MPYALSPAPSNKHQRLASELSMLFGNALTGCKKCNVFQPVNYKIKDDTVLQPDLSMLCRPFTHPNYIDFPPTLVVEILSPSSNSKDNNEKYELYEMNGVKYYLMIDPSFQKLEIFELVDNTYQPMAVNPSSYKFDLEECKATIDFTTLFDE